MAKKKNSKTFEITQTKTKGNREEININNIDYKTAAEPKAYTSDGIPVFCSHDKIVPIKELRENPLNPNQHPDDQIRALASIILATGYRDRITVSTRSGLIVKGHGRLRAAKHAGLKEAPVDYQNYASEEEEIADLLADNQLAELAYIDSVKLADAFEAVDTGNIPFELTGYEESFYQELATALSEAEHNETDNIDEDDVLPPPEAPFSKLGDVWILGRHRLMCGDCTQKRNREILFDGNTPEILLTDPPYCSGGFNESGKSAGSIGTDRKGEKKVTIANDTLSTRGYQQLIKQMLDELPCLIAYAFTDWRMWIYLYDMMESSGFGVKSMIVWDKETPGMGMGWRAQHELCMFAHRTKTQFDGHKGYGNVLRCSRSGNELHPTQKPVELMQQILDNTEWASGVYDPFGGSGTTLIAAENLGQTAYLMELTPGYTDVIVKRYARLAGTNDIKLIRDGQEMPPEYFAEVFDSIDISTNYQEGEYE